MSEQVKWGKTFGLAAALAGLGLFAFWLENEHKPEKERTADAEKRVLKLNGKTFSEIRIRTSDAENVFQCLDLKNKLCKSTDQSNWLMTQPASVKADSANVNGFLSSMQSMTSIDQMDLSSETAEKRAQLLKEYGLDPDARQKKGARAFELIDSDGNRSIVHFGEVNPLNDGFFVGLSTGTAAQEPQFNPNKIYIVPAYLRTNFDHDTTYWRDKKLFSLSTSEIMAFDIKGPKGQASATRNGNLWTVRYPEKGTNITVPGDFENIETLLNAATMAQAQSFQTPQAMKGSALSLTLTLKKSSEDAGVTLTVFTHPNSKSFAKVSGLDPVFGMDAGFLTRVNRSATDLRRVKLLTTMQRFGIEKVTVHGKTFESSNEKVQDLLDKLSGNQIIGIQTGIQPAPSDKKTTIQFHPKNDAIIELNFWKTGKGDLFASETAGNTGAPSIAYKLAPSLESSLPFDASFFQVTLKQ